MIRPVPSTRLALNGPDLDHWGFVAHTCGYSWHRSHLAGEAMATLGHNLAIAGALLWVARSRNGTVVK